MIDVGVKDSTLHQMVLTAYRNPNYNNMYNTQAICRVLWNKQVAMD